MRCEPDADYEAWQVVGGWPQSLVVCTPGGELAIVDSTHVPSAEEAQRTIDQLNELTSWNVSLREVTDTGGIIVDPARGDDDTSPPSQRTADWASVRKCHPSGAGRSRVGSSHTSSWPGAIRKRQPGGRPR